MSLRSSVVCDQCGKESNHLPGWLRLSSTTSLNVKAPAHSGQRPDIDLCSRECAGAYFFGPVAT